MNLVNQLLPAQETAIDSMQDNLSVPIIKSVDKKQLPNRLLRVALINSYPKGQAHLLNVENNCILTGHNSAGKTTLMGAIAPFYGVPLSAIARKSEVNKSFIEFYLPYDNSYIVYEYVRDGQLRCVILRGQEKKQIFTFVNGGYNDAWFIDKKNDELYFKQSPEVTQTIKSQGLHVSSNISQLEYEAIISNCPNKRLKITAPQSRRTIANYRPDYSLTSDPKATFFGFAPIVNNVFQTQLEFDDICAFLVEAMKMQDMLSGDELKLDDVNIDTAKWVRQRETWQQIENLKPKFETLSQVLSSNIAHQQQLAETQAEGSNLLSSINNEIMAKGEEKQAFDNQYNKVKSEASDKENAWYSTKSKLESDIKLASNEINRIENKKREYEEGTQDKYQYEAMHKLKERVAQIESLELQQVSKEDSLKAYRKQLEKTRANLDAIERLFDNEKNQLDKTFQTTRSHISDMKGATELEFSEKYREIERVLAKNKQGIQEQFRIQSKNIAEKINQAQINIAKLEAKANNLPFSESAQNAIDNNTNEIASLRTQLKANYTKLNKAREEHERIKNEIDSQLAKQRHINETIKLHQEKKAHLESLVQGNTLFSFLINSEIDNTLTTTVSNIRKTINPDLLKREDLNPNWLLEDEDYSITNNTQESLYGLSLNTSAINTPDTQTYADIAREIAGHEDSIELNNANLADIETDLKKLDKLKGQNSQEMTQLQHTERKIETDIENLEEHKHYLQTEAEQEKQQHLIEIQQQIETLYEELKASRTKLEALELEERNEFTALDDAYKLEIERLNSAKKSRLDDLANQLKKAEEKYKVDLAEAKDRKDKAIDNEGYDPSILDEIEKDIESLRAKLLTAEQAKRRIDDYNSFLESEYSELEGFRSWKSELETNLISQQNDYDEYAGDTQRLIDELDKKIAKTSERLRVLKEDDSRLSTHLKKLELTLNPALVNTASHPSESKNTLTQEDAHLQTERVLRSIQSNTELAEATIKQGIKLVEAIKKPFFDNESMFETLLSQSEVMGRTIETNWFLQSNLFIDYMNNEHESKREIIVARYIAEAEKINNFKYDLDNADRNLNKFTSNINKNCSDICDNLNALAIEEFQMSISSSIKDNEWYKVLDDFSKAYDNWRGAERINQPMPSEHLLASLDKVQHFIGQNKLNVKFAQQFSMDLMVKQHGQQARTATKTNSFKALSSNGTMRIAQLIIYLSLLSMISTATNTELKLFIDEIGVLDPQNTKELLELLKSQKVSAMCAAPQVVDDAVIPLFTNNIACSRDKSNTYRLSQTDDLSSLTQEAIMEAHGVFDL